MPDQVRHDWICNVSLPVQIFVFVAPEKAGAYGCLRRHDLVD